MSDPLSGLEPRSLWGHFSKVLSIPRPSKQEQRIAGWIRSLASERGWRVNEDRAGNLVLGVPATPGAESAPIVILQSHLDMVCEKDREVEHDFSKDPIRARLEDGWVRATGTTLGADNGIGVAAALAAATDPAVVHGPLELLFTVDEETGLTGAQQLDGSMLQGRLLLNLDSEEDGKLFVGCAGGSDCRVVLEGERDAVPRDAVPLSLSVRGLRGGHSGLQIHQNLGNAIKLLTRALLAACDAGIDLRVASIAGGSKHNAIPREAEALVFVPSGSEESFTTLWQEQAARFRRELAGSDDGLEMPLSSKVSDAGASAFTARDSRRIVDLLAVLPHGMLALSADVPGLVETSCNLAVVKTEGVQVEVTSSARSSVDSRMESVVGAIEAAARLACANSELRNSYPGWKPDLGSRALAVVRESWTELYGAPEITAVHAGLECGLLGERIPDCDMISFGPQIEGAHSPAEQVEVASVERFWNALVLALRKLES